MAPQKTENLVGPLFHWLNLDETARSFRAMKAFWDAAGSRIRTHARAERLRGSILYVRVESAAWSQELSILKSALLEKLRKTSGGEQVQDLRFNVGALSEVPDWSVPTALARQELLPVPETVPDELMKTFAQMKDGELRDELTSLLMRVGVRRRK